MFLKALVAILGMAVIGIVLLGYRQQRFEVMHEMTRIHSQMNDSRQTIWETQSKIAGRLQPQRLAAAIDRAKLALEPAAPGWIPAEQRLVKATNKIRKPMRND